MHQNHYWKFFLLTMFLIAIVSTLFFSYRFYFYYQLDMRTLPTSVSWSVERISEDHFCLKAQYSFRYSAQENSGNYILEYPYYRNKWAAEEVIRLQNSKQVSVWFSKRNPQYSALERNFPTKECLSTLTLWGLFLYFLGLGYYTAKLYHTG